jgi:hypothetical protein
MIKSVLLIKCCSGCICYTNGGVLVRLARIQPLPHFINNTDFIKHLSTVLCNFNNINIL